MVKTINDLKKDNERLKITNEKLLSRVEVLEKELASVSDELKKQEELWIHNVENSPTLPMAQNATFNK